MKTMMFIELNAKHFNQLRFHSEILFDLLGFVYVTFNILNIKYLADASFHQTCKRFNFET